MRSCCATLSRLTRIHMYVYVLRSVCVIHLRRCMPPLLRCKLAASLHCKARNSHLLQCHLGFFFVLCSHFVRCGSDFLSYFFTLHALLRTHVHKYVYENCNKVHLLLLLLPLQLLWRTCSPPLHLLLPCCGKLVINSTQRAAVGLRLSSLTPYVCFAICKL